MTRRLKVLGLLAVLMLQALLVSAEQRFPPPEFENGYAIPTASTPAARQLWLQYVDAGVFLAALGIAVWMIYRKRSRRGLFWLSLFSLAYFGFYRKGCICPIGSPQNVVYGLFNPDYSVPVTVLLFCFAPIVVALFAGRAFCAGVCPQGALQDFLLIKPVKVPPWLEQSLSVVPFIFLGAGLIYAGTGTGFVICRYDPFVPFFRLSGGAFIVAIGAVFLLTGMFVGRAYCRFLCPYGGLLQLASLASKWRVRVTPDTCTQCRLCEQSCPFGAMREPTPANLDQNTLGVERRRLGWLIALLPVLVAGGGWGGSKFSPAAAQLHPTVALAERYVRQQKNPVEYGLMTPEALSLQRAEESPEAILAAAAALRHRFDLACALFGGWIGLVIGVKLIALSLRTRRTDFEPDQGACFACARCFTACPNERVRLGWMPAAEQPTTP
jgi:polyferredoxin